jgi:chemotaxis signal transduction protein
VLRLRGKQQQKQGIRASWTFLVFSVGGRRLAVKTLDVASISPWSSSIPVGSRTPFVAAVVRHDQTVLPVFDLASVLGLHVQGNHPLCLRIKHRLGDMVMCIDEEIPVLHTLESSAVQLYKGKDLPAEGSYISGLDEIPILSVPQLGSCT